MSAAPKLEHRCLHFDDRRDPQSQCPKTATFLFCPEHERERDRQRHERQEQLERAEYDRVRRLPDEELLDVLRDYGLCCPPSKGARLARVARDEVLRRMGQRA